MSSHCGKKPFNGCDEDGLIRRSYREPTVGVSRYGSYLMAHHFQAGCLNTYVLRCPVTAALMHRDCRILKMAGHSICNLSGTASGLE